SSGEESPMGAPAPRRNASRASGSRSTVGGGSGTFSGRRRQRLGLTQEAARIDVFSPAGLGDEFPQSAESRPCLVPLAEPVLGHRQERQVRRDELRDAFGLPQRLQGVLITTDAV